MNLRSLARLVLPAVGFALVCIGVYLVSNYVNIPAYIMIVLGFLTIVIGVFWSMCHNMTTKMYQRGGHQHHIQVYTIDSRPSSFPPSYEESQRSQVSPHAVPDTVVVMSLAPPLYSHDSEAPDCTWSQEQPPRYSQVERFQQGQVDAVERREALSKH